MEYVGIILIIILFICVALFSRGDGRPHRRRGESSKSYEKRLHDYKKYKL